MFLKITFSLAFIAALIMNYYDVEDQLANEKKALEPTENKTNDTIDETIKQLGFIYLFLMISGGIVLLFRLVEMVCYYLLRSWASIRQNFNQTFLSKEAIMEYDDNKLIRNLT